MVKEYIDNIPTRVSESHKGDYGKVFIVAGSRGMTGAAYLASQGALVSGSGLVTCGVPESVNDILEIKLTEVMTLPLSETRKCSINNNAKKDILQFGLGCDAVGIGPGLGMETETISLVKAVVRELGVPMVIDADALNAIGEDVSIVAERKSDTVLTPHPGEAGRLLGMTTNEVQESREHSACKLSELSNAIVCLKGHKTVVCAPNGKMYINTTGNSGMATGGTGDVLTGMITSFIGQGIDAYSASVSAVYLHGLAGDIAAKDIGPFSLIASDLLDYLPEAFSEAGL